MFKSLFRSLFDVRGGVDTSDEYIAERAKSIKERASTNFLKQRKSSFFNFLIFALVALAYSLLIGRIEHTAITLNAEGSDTLKVVNIIALCVFGKAQVAVCLILAVLCLLRYILLSLESITSSEKEKINRIGLLITPLFVIGAMFSFYTCLQRPLEYLKENAYYVSSAYRHAHDIELAAKAIGVEDWQGHAIADYVAERSVAGIHQPSIGNKEADVLAFVKLKKDVTALKECAKIHTGGHDSDNTSDYAGCKAELRAYAASKAEMNKLNKGNRTILSNASMDWLMTLIPASDIQPSLIPRVVPK